MIERVAKAILETPNASDYEELVARNAINAMLEPTEHMLLNCDSSLMHGELKQIYSSMIKAALSEHS